MSLAIELLGSFVPGHIVEGLGWTIVHSLWQGAAIAVVFGLVMVMMRRHESKSRYAAGVITLALMVAMSVFTFINVAPGNSPVAAAQENPNSANSLTTVIIKPAVQTPAAVASGNPGLFQNITSFFSTYFSRHLPLIVTIWLLGALTFLLKLGGGYLLNLRIKSHRITPVPREWQTRFSALCKKTRVTRPVRFVESAMVKVPVAIGHLKPVVLFPVGMITGMPGEQIEALLTHELAHIVRRDYLVNILQGIVEVMFFYHPAVWWISSHVREEREHCCDDIAVALSGDSMNFARALTSVQERCLNLPQPALAITGKKRGLFVRIKRLFNPPRRRSRLFERFTGAFIMAICLLTLFVGANAASHINNGKEKPKAPKPPKPPKVATIPAHPAIPPAATKPAAAPAIPILAPRPVPPSTPAPRVPASEPAKATPAPGPRMQMSTASYSTGKNNQKQFILVMEKSGLLRISAVQSLTFTLTGEKSGKTIWKLASSNQKKWKDGLTFQKDFKLEKGKYKLIFKGETLKFSAQAVRIDAGENKKSTTLYFVPANSFTLQQTVLVDAKEKFALQREKELEKYEQEFDVALDRLKEKEAQLQKKAGQIPEEHIRAAERKLQAQITALEEQYQKKLNQLRERDLNRKIDEEDRLMRKERDNKRNIQAKMAAMEREMKEKQMQMERRHMDRMRDMERDRELREKKHRQTIETIKTNHREMEKKLRLKQEQLEKQQAQQKKVFATIREQLKKDKLAGPGKISLRFTSRALYIDEKKVDQKVYQKYRQLLETLMGKKITGRSQFVYIDE